MLFSLVIRTPTLAFGPVQAQLVLAAKKGFGEAAAQERKSGSTS